MKRLKRSSITCLMQVARLAEAKGACDWFSQTKYAQGQLPIDHYRKSLDANPDTSFELKMPWEELRGRIREYGLRNSTLTAQMPCETSSQIHQLHKWYPNRRVALFP
ncbi:hypothetical protein RBI80_29385 (plasmid) [Klebsiella variicola]|nr:hypothetical protein RBI80_29385 [Klebsiella variicola]